MKNVYIFISISSHIFSFNFSRILRLDATNYLTCGLSVLFMVVHFSFIFINNYEVTPVNVINIMSTSFKYFSQLVKLKQWKVYMMRLD